MVGDETGGAGSNRSPSARDAAGRGTMVLMTSLPEWLYPGPDGGWTADDLDKLPPDAPRRIELIDGALVLMSPQTAFHMLVIDLVVAGMRPPGGLHVAREMSVRLNDRQRPEPD